MKLLYGWREIFVSTAYLFKFTSRLDFKMPNKHKAKRRKRMPVDSDSDSDSEDGTHDSDGNHLYFWCDVTKSSCLDLTMRLNKTFQRLRQCVYPGDTITPIYLHINSYGGDVDAALGVIDTMKSLEKQGARIITIIEGYVASAATLISVAGTERRMRPNAVVRIHQFRSGCWGKKSEIDDEHANLDKLETIIVNFYTKYTKIKKKPLKKMLKRELDLLIDECITNGLVDAIQD